MRCRNQCKVGKIYVTNWQLYTYSNRFHHAQQDKNLHTQPRSQSTIDRTNRVYGGPGKREKRMLSVYQVLLDIFKYGTTLVTVVKWYYTTMLLWYYGTIADIVLWPNGSGSEMVLYYNVTMVLCSTVADGWTNLQVATGLEKRAGLLSGYSVILLMGVGGDGLIGCTYTYLHKSGQVEKYKYKYK